MTRVSKLMLDNKVDYINRLLGLTEMTFRIEYYNGTCRVVRKVSGVGCTTNISMLGTKRETLTFLEGMQNGLEFGKTLGFAKL